MKRRILYLFALLCTAQLSFASVQDSTGVEKKGNAWFILHRMEQGETLYALSRRYNVTVPEIKNANPGVNIADIAIGQIIYVPAKNYKGPATASTPANTGSSGNGAKKHKVQAKETLYSLSRQYDVSVDEIKKANPGVEKGLQVGMELIIPAKGAQVAATAPKKDEPAKTTTTTNGPATTNTSTASQEPKTTAQPVKTASPARSTPVPLEIPSSNTKIDKISENGFAELAQSRADAPDFFAYHKTAPVGTIIQVTNEANGQTAFVRVIGGLVSPADGVSIQLSQKALQRLNSSDKKFKVNISYFLP